MLINVAFITLMERKILGLIQYRKGPNKVSVLGILQPIRDAAKLFLKEFTRPSMGNNLLFSASPLSGLFLALLIWVIFPLRSAVIIFSLGGILILVILGFGSYPLFLRGWASNRKYAMVGSLRGIAQTISYEIRLALIVFRVLLLRKSLSVRAVSEMTRGYLSLLICPFLLILWLVSCVAETNRTPFDFSEGESELVSGFNIEYGGLGFTFIFMAEYSIIIFFGALSSVLFLRLPSSKAYIRGLVVSLGFLWIWLRATYPRYRYDKLIGVAWKAILPLVLSILIWVTRRGCSSLATGPPIIDW